MRCHHRLPGRSIALSSIILLSVAVALPANAGLKLEPYLGYWNGKLEQSSNYFMATSGLLLGSRGGISLGNLVIGADYMFSTGSGNQSGSTGEYSIHEFGPSLGLEFPGFGQLYGSLLIKSKAKLQPDVNTNYYTGSGFRIGFGAFGWARLRSLSLNFEYISRTFNQYNSTDLSQAQKEKAFALTASMPLPAGSSGSSYNAPGPTSSE